MTTYAITNGTQELFTDNLELVYAVKQLLLQFTTDFEIGIVDGDIIWSRSDGIVDGVPEPSELNTNVFGLAGVFVAALCNTPFYVYHDRNRNHHLFASEKAMEAHAEELNRQDTTNGYITYVYDPYKKDIYSFDDVPQEDMSIMDLDIEEIFVKV